MLTLLKFIQENQLSEASKKWYEVYSEDFQNPFNILNGKTITIAIDDFSSKPEMLSRYPEEVGDVYKDCPVRVSIFNAYGCYVSVMKKLDDARKLYREFRNIHNAKNNQQLMSFLRKNFQSM